MTHTLQHAEAPKIRKNSTVLIDNYYNNPTTSLLTFHFEPHLFKHSLLRIKNSRINHALVEGKDIYLLDDFFTTSEGDDMRKFSSSTSFSRNSYGSEASIAKGEKPARSMDSKERWHFFSNPPGAVQEIYKLLNTLANVLDADITTLPWDLCHHTTSSPTVVANFLEEASGESMDLGKHKDCNPENGLSFGTLKLYSQEEMLYPSQFINGSIGHPWIVSLMLYATEASFSPDFHMGTVFYYPDGKPCLSANCNHMRLVIFEGDILHSIEASKLPKGYKTWRVSYVFKLIFNPTKKSQSLKKDFLEFSRNSSKIFNNIHIEKNLRC